MITKITKAEGSHLTATNKKHLVTLLNHESFVYGSMFKVGRIHYVVNELEGDRIEIKITQTSKDDFGRSLTRTYTSTALPK